MPISKVMIDGYWLILVHLNHIIRLCLNNLLISLKSRSKMSVLHWYILPIIGVFSAIVYLIFLTSLLRLIYSYKQKKNRDFNLPYTDTRNVDVKSNFLFMIPIIISPPPETLDSIQTVTEVWNHSIISSAEIQFCKS